MTDPRIYRLADVLVNYSMELQPGEEVAIRTSPLADELTLAVYKAALLVGAHPYIFSSVPGQQEMFFKYASDEQLEFISPINRLVTEKFKAILDIHARHNTRELSGVDPERMARSRRASADLFDTFVKRIGTRDVKWCYTVYPTNASAQEADMSLADYTEFVFGAGMLDLADPVSAWKTEGEKQHRLIEWLAGKEQVRISGKDVDLRLSIKGRQFLGACGHENFPDGEIYTSPVEDSVEGWIRFAYPAIFSGKEVIDIQLWFEGGTVVREQAGKSQQLLTGLLNTDAGARRLGELGIGTNYSIRRFTKDMLFDEKLGGTIHLAVGRGFPEVGGKNESGLHWDMLCDMSQSEIRVDGALFYKDGQFVV
jgi:aminopeptidase